MNKFSKIAIKLKKILKKLIKRVSHHSFIAKIPNKKPLNNSDGMKLTLSKTFSLKIKIINRKIKLKMTLLMTSSLLVLRRFKTFLQTADNLIGGK